MNQRKGKMQLELFSSPEPDLQSYDVILINSSAGKDSQAMLDYLAERATLAGVRDRLLVVHCDLGRAEWPGTRELAEKQAIRYGLRFEVVSNRKDLITRLNERKQWPDAARRYCTSEQKTHQVVKLMTRLVREAGRHLRILNCLGLRADESPKRAKKPIFSLDSATNGKRHVDRWLPIHRWTVEEVWAWIKASPIADLVHPAYSLGMPRLSCRFCILASRSALVLSAKLNPELAQEYVEIEARIGHRFRMDFTIKEIVEEAARTATVGPIASWEA